MAGAGTYTGEKAGALSYFIAPIMPYVAFGDPTDPSKACFFQRRRDQSDLRPADAVADDHLAGDAAEVCGDEGERAAELPASRKARNCAAFSNGTAPSSSTRTATGTCSRSRRCRIDAVHMQHRDEAFSVAYDAGAAMTQVVTRNVLTSRPTTRRRRIQLMYFDGWDTDLPVVDNVVKLKFQVLRRSAAAATDRQAPDDRSQDHGRPTVPSRPHSLDVKGDYPAGENCTFKVVGGQQVPRLPVLGAGGIAPSRAHESRSRPTGRGARSADKPNRFDADLLRIRRVRVTLRVQAALASMRGPAGVLFTHGGTRRWQRLHSRPGSQLRRDAAKHEPWTLTCRLSRPGNRSPANKRGERSRAHHRAAVHDAADGAGHGADADDDDGAAHLEQLS